MEIAQELLRVGPVANREVGVMPISESLEVCGATVRRGPVALPAPGPALVGPERPVLPVGAFFALGVEMEDLDHESHVRITRAGALWRVADQEMDGDPIQDYSVVCDATGGWVKIGHLELDALGFVQVELKPELSSQDYDELARKILGGWANVNVELMAEDGTLQDLDTLFAAVDRGDHLPLAAHMTSVRPDLAMAVEDSLAAAEAGLEEARLLREQPWLFLASQWSKSQYGEDYTASLPTHPTAPYRDISALDWQTLQRERLSPYLDSLFRARDEGRSIPDEVSAQIESLSALYAKPGNGPLAINPPPSRQEHYVEFDYRMAKAFLKDAKVVLEGSTSEQGNTFYLKPDGAIWSERERPSEGHYSLDLVPRDAILQGGPEAVLQALREEGFLPALSDALSGQCEGLALPDHLRRVSEKICKGFGVTESTAPGFIANVVAKELGIGDGRGRFFLAGEGVPAWRLNNVEQHEIGDALGRLNGVMREEGADTLTLRLSNAPGSVLCVGDLTDWRASVKTGANEGWYVRLEAYHIAQSRNEIIADVKVLDSLDEAVKISNMVTAWLQTQGL